MRIALVGYMGSGKSTIGRLLAERMNLPFIDLDTRIELREKSSIAAIFSHKGEAYFRKSESETLSEIVRLEKSFILATGGGTPCFFNQMELLNHHCVTIYLECSSKRLQERITQSLETRPLLSQLTNGIEDHLSERVGVYSQAHHVVNGELSPHDLFEYIHTEILRR